MGSGKCVECNQRLSHDETFYWVDKEGGEGICADCTVKKIERQRDALAEKVDRLTAHLEAEKGNYWSWQGDGEDHLESLVCPVVIQPKILEKIIGEKASFKLQLAHEKTLTARARDALARLGTMPTLHEGNKVSIEIKREDYNYIRATRPMLLL